MVLKADTNLTVFRGHYRDFAREINSAIPNIVIAGANIIFKAPFKFCEKYSQVTIMQGWTGEITYPKKILVYIRAKSSKPTSFAIKKIGKIIEEGNKTLPVPTPRINPPIIHRIRGGKGIVAIIRSTPEILKIFKKKKIPMRIRENL